MRNLPLWFHREAVFEVQADFAHDEHVTGTPQLDGWTPTFAAGNMTTIDRVCIADGGAIPFGPAILEIEGTAVADQFHSYLRTLEEFLFTTGLPIRFRADLPAGRADQNLDELNIFIGCMEDMDTATELQDDGLGPRADSDMFGFFKVAEVTGAYNGAVWNCVSGFGANQQITELIPGNRNNLSGEYQKMYADTIFRNPVTLIAEWMPTGPVPGVAAVAPTILDAEVRFWINDVLVAKHTMAGQYQITLATAESMNFGYVSRTGLDQAIFNHLSYLKCTQLRGLA